MLNLVWSALFNDGSRLFQFSDDSNQMNETEVPAKRVFDNQENLVEFGLYNVRTGTAYVVDLKLGIIKTIRQGGAIAAPEEDVLGDRDYRYRLIYFRRVRRDFNSSLSQIGEANITYFLGYQFTDEFGKNHKKLIQIRDDDGVTIY